MGVRGRSPEARNIFKIFAEFNPFFIKIYTVFCTFGHNH